MTLSKRVFFSRTDLLIAAVFLLTAAVLAGINARSEKESTAEIWYDGAFIDSVSLSEDRTFSIQEVPSVTFQVQDGTIRFLSSDCPDQTCVRTGAISRSGQYAICLPHKLMILIPGEKDPSAPDAVTSQEGGVLL